MVTPFDKAIVALLMGILGLLNHFFGFNIGLTESQLHGFILAVTPILVYLIPNKKTS